MPQPMGILGTGSYLPGEPVPPERVEDVLGAIPNLPDRIGGRAARIGAEVVNREAPRQLIEGLGEMLEAAGIAGPDVAHFLLGIPGRHFMTDAMVALFIDRVIAAYLGESSKWMSGGFLARA